MLDGEPTLKERVIAFFKGAPRRYSFAPEMDPAARAWLREYKKLFDEVARLNSGNNVAEDLNSGFGIQNSESSGTATKVPEKVIKKIGKIVEDSDNSPKKIIKLGQIVENAQKTPLTNIDQGNMQVSGERSAIYYPKFTEQDIENNINDIALMESVKDIPEDKLKKTGKKPRDLYEEFFESLGYNIHSSVFGDIELSKASAKSEIRHGLTAEKIASIEAIPEVIEKGKVIFHQTKPKSDVDRIVIAAPINIGSELYFMGVMLQRDSVTQRLYLHNVVAVKEKEARTTSQDYSLTNWSGEEDSRLFITSILQKAINVKLNKEKNLGNNLNSDPDGRSALSDSKKVTSSDVARVKGAISEMNIDPRSIMAVADSYFGRYDGSLTRTALRFEFLEAAQLMLGSEKDAYDRAYARIEAIADELTYNEKDSSGFSDDLKEIQRHIREITFAVRDQDKGEFDSLGGFGEFRKKYFGRLKIANEGTSVDAVYGELQTLYGLSLFPDLNTAQEMLIRIGEVVDMDPKAEINSDVDLNDASSDLAVEITHKLVQAFDNKLTKKISRMSKADAEAYKARINARAEMKAAKAIARAKARFESETAKIKAKADTKVEKEIPCGIGLQEHVKGHAQ